MALLPTKYTIDAPVPARPVPEMPLSFVKISNDTPAPFRPVLSFPWKFRMSFEKWFGLRIRIGPKMSPLKLKLPESDQVGSPLFAKLPAEIRLNIYSLLLISPHPIESPHRLFRSEPVLLLHNRPPAPSIDAVFLCTCQKIHREALPVLYGNNTLAFSSPDGLEHFAHTQLQRRSSAEASVDPRYLPMLQLTEALFNFNFTAAGRFHLVRDLQVRLALSDYPDRYAQPYRADLVFVWFSMLHDQSRVPRVASFPALETLPLDFSDWGLGQDDALIVKLFVDNFHGRGRGLKKLAIKGVSHQQTLDQFRTGLLEEGGRFEVIQ